MHTSDEEVCTSPDEANELMPETEPPPFSESEERYLCNGGLMEPSEEEPGSEAEPPPLSEFEEHYLRNGDLMETSEEEARPEREPPPLSEFE